MKTMKNGFSPAVIGLAAALGLTLAGAHRANAAQDLSLTQSPRLRLLSPTAKTDFQGTRPIEIDALYEGSPGNGIVNLDLYIDGIKAQSQALDSPETKGIVSFLVDSSLMTPGMHYVVVRATAADAEVKSVRGEFYYGAPPGAPAIDGSSGDQNALAWPAVSGASPQLHLMYPLPDSKIQGSVTIRVDANDTSGGTPYVSMFVDGQMKQLVNYRPFEYVWDTTTLPNGWHTIAVVEAFENADAPVAHLDPIRVYINNPGGDTFIRTDLMDGTKTAKPAFSEPITAPVEHSPLARIAVPHKSSLQPLQARRPRGSALLAPGLMPSFSASEHRSLMADADPRWDTMNAMLNPALSPPTLQDLPVTVKPSSIKAKAATVATRRPSAARIASSRAEKLGSPSVAYHTGIVAGLRPPMLMAQTPTLDEGRIEPIMALPSLPNVNEPSRIMAVTSHVHVGPKPERILTAAPMAQALRLRIHVPELPMISSKVFAPHVGLGAASMVKAIGETRVQFNNSPVTLDRPLAMKSSVVFGPLRRLFEYGGGSLQWHAQTGVVQAQMPSRDIELTIGQKQALINNRPFQLSSAPYINAGRTMVPVTFLSAALDATVQFDPATGHLKITSLH